MGRHHRSCLFEKLGLDPAIDYPTVEFLGNTGAVALPITAALGIENGCLRRGDHVALWGVGSGINVVALGVDWQGTLVDDEIPAGSRWPASSQAANPWPALLEAEQCASRRDAST